jgi:pSer/pThr/pTyr-binding forkhead associated (FHA) protein
MSEPYLRIFGGEEGCREFELPLEDLYIGRTDENGIQLASRSVSRRHAVIKPEAKGFVIEDAGSKAGTFVNGQKLESQASLNHGDTIQIVNFVLQYRTDQSTLSIEGNPFPFNLLPSSMGIRYRVFKYDPAEIFEVGDTIAVGSGGVMVPVTGEEPEEKSVIEVELKWPNGNKKTFMAELIGVIEKAGKRCMCLKLHSADEEEVDRMMKHPHGQWIEIKPD